MSERLFLFTFRLSCLKTWARGGRGDSDVRSLTQAGGNDGGLWLSVGRSPLWGARLVTRNVHQLQRRVYSPLTTASAIFIPRSLL